MKDKGGTKGELLKEIQDLQNRVADLEDIRARNARTERALRESEARFRLFSEAPFEAIFLSDKGVCIGQNLAAEKMFGYSEEEAFGRNGTEWIAPEYRDLALQNILAGYEEPYEAVAFRKDGSTFLCEILGKNVNYQGRIIRVTALRDITDRKKAEEALRSSRSELHAIYEYAPVMMCVLDAQRQVLYANRALADFVGKNENELKEGRACGVFGCINALDDPRGCGYGPHCETCSLRLAIEDTLKTGVGHRAIEYRSTLIGKDLRREVVLLGSTALIQAGDRSSVLLCLEDVTDRKRAEEEREETLSLLRATLESTADAILAVDAEGRMVAYNRLFANICGIPEQVLSSRSDEEALRFALDKLKYPDDFLKRVRDIYAKPEMESFDVLELRDGRILERYSLPQSVGQKIVGRVWSFRDVTERKRAEEALRASEEKYRLLVDKAQEAILVIQDSVFRFVNRRFEEIVGFPADELIGKSFGSFVHPDDRDGVIEKHYRRLKGEVFPSRYEIRIVDKQQGVKWVEIDSAMIDWEGKTAVMVFLTDITYRRLAEEAAMQTERLQAIADLSGGVAHHFNNLLHIVMASASLSLADLESGDLTEIKATLEKMLEAATRGSEMVKRLQTFADIRSDITDAEAATFDVAATATSAVEVSKPFWKAEPEKRGTKVNLQLNLEDGCLVQGKENEISEVLVHLIKNAAEALPDGGDMEVQVVRDADEVVIKVRDTGMGIAEDDLTRVFEPFWSTRGVGIGKGMGLAVTHGLVKRHGGTISVHSKVGAGTTFTVRLPLAHQPVTKTEQLSTGAAVVPLTILVIEDELYIAALLERILAKAGHRVFKSLSGREGLAIFDKESVDLVLCDLGMPGMNGWDVGKAIRLVCREKGIPKPPFVLLTGWGGQELEREKIAESGTDAVVAKPIDSAALLATVREAASRFTNKAHDK